MTKIHCALGALALSVLVLAGAPAVAGDGNDQSSSQRSGQDDRFSGSTWRPMGPRAMNMQRATPSATRARSSDNVNNN